jgi:biotin-dependent carboxylase-like uncharacterized protein
MADHLSVLQPGLLVTVQDRGRYGYQEFGVPVAGAIDQIGLRLANALVGNPAGEGCLEICYLGPTLRVEALSVRLAVYGQVDIVLTEDNGLRRPIESNRTHLLKQGDVIAIGAVSDSSVAYMAVAGGFALEPFMGSVSTYLRGHLGPLSGSALRAGMVLALREGDAEDKGEVAFSKPWRYGEGPIRVILGPQDDCFTEESISAFLAGDYSVTKEADRMGMRLAGPQLHHRLRADIASDALVSGSIQVPGNGQPIILLADHQTTGGYAKIATVISADLSRVGRSLPESTLRFRAVTVEEAEAARRAQEEAIRSCMDAIADVNKAKVTRLEDRLWSSNLVSGTVDALGDVF